MKEDEKDDAVQKENDQNIDNICKITRKTRSNSDAVKSEKVENIKEVINKVKNTNESTDEQVSKSPERKKTKDGKSKTQDVDIGSRRRSGSNDSLKDEKKDTKDINKVKNDTSIKKPSTENKIKVNNA